MLQEFVIATFATPPVESVTLTVKEKTPAASGVPLIRPELERLSPAGRLPLLSVKVQGAVPPQAMTCETYGMPVTPDVPGAQATDNGAGPMVIPQSEVIFTWAVLLVLSVTLTVKLLEPAVVGVPLMTPEAAFSVSPDGSDPVAMAKLKGAVPPVA